MVTVLSTADAICSQRARTATMIGDVIYVGRSEEKLVIVNGDSISQSVIHRFSAIDGSPLPDLVITDGGIGQMNVVRQVVEDELHLQIPIAGLAKDDRHRTNELLFGFPPQTIGLKTDSELFHVLTRIQDEVHRYAITFHRDKRSKHALHSALDDVKGIGPKTRELLIKELKSVKRVQNADIQTLTSIIGISKAKIIYNYFHSNEAGMK